MAKASTSSRSKQGASVNRTPHFHCSVLAEQLNALLQLASDHCLFDQLPVVVRQTVLNLACETSEALQAKLALLAPTEGGKA